MAKDKQEMWTKTAEGLDEIIKQIDEGDLMASKQGRAFLAGASTAIRALTAKTDDKPGPAKVTGM